MHNAQQAGASAAIVYDDTFEPLIIMSKPLGHSDPGIPAVFVSEKTGIVMQKFLTTGTVTVQIIQVCQARAALLQYTWKHTLCSLYWSLVSNATVSMQVTDAVWVSMLMSALAGIVAVCLMIATFYCIRYSHAYRAADPAPLLLCGFTVSLPCTCSAQHEVLPAYRQEQVQVAVCSIDQLAF